MKTTQNAWARLAGFMYLFVIVSYVAAMLIIGRFRVPADIAETARRIAAAETLYRAGMAFNLVAALGTVLLAMGLYVILKSVDPDLALLALVFRIVEATLTGAQVVVGFTILKFYAASAAFSAGQISAILDLRAAAGSASYNIGATFFGFGSTLFFVLFIRSRILPRALCWIGLVGSVLVPVICIGSLVLPRYAGALQYGWAPIAVAEVVGGFWLLIKGVGSGAFAGGTRQLHAALSTDRSDSGRSS